MTKANINPGYMLQMQTYAGDGDEYFNYTGTGLSKDTVELYITVARLADSFNDVDTETTGKALDKLVSKFIADGKDIPSDWVEELNREPEEDDEFDGKYSELIFDLIGMPQSWPDCDAFNSFGYAKVHFIPTEAEDVTDEFSYLYS